MEKKVCEFRVNQAKLGQTNDQVMSSVEDRANSVSSSTGPLQTVPAVEETQAVKKKRQNVALFSIQNSNKAASQPKPKSPTLKSENQAKLVFPSFFEKPSSTSNGPADQSVNSQVR